MDMIPNFLLLVLYDLDWIISRREINLRTVHFYFELICTSGHSVYHMGVFVVVVVATNTQIRYTYIYANSMPSNRFGTISWLLVSLSLYAFVAPSHLISRLLQTVIEICLRSKWLKRCVTLASMTRKRCRRERFCDYITISYAYSRHIYTLMMDRSRPKWHFKFDDTKEKNVRCMLNCSITLSCHIKK